MSTAAAPINGAASMEDQPGFIWLDGNLVEWRKAQVHVLSHTLHHGMGIFEGVRAYQTEKGPALFRVQDHTERFLRSAHILQIELPFGLEALKKAQHEVIAANELGECYVRPIAFYGGERVGVSAVGNTVHVAIATWPWKAYLGADAQRDGIRVKTSSFSRHHINSLMVHAKACGHYINSMLANREAVSQGYDETLMLDVQGYAAEGSTENLFIVRKGILHTPEPSTVLEGVTRDSIIVLARDLNIEVIERKITRDEIYCADEAFFTGTAAEITPIRELDGRKIGAARVGPMTRALQEAYFATVRGCNPARAHWLSLI
jgi:branched-chain amino acid aminotransferase